MADFVVGSKGIVTHINRYGFNAWFEIGEPVIFKPHEDTGTAFWTTNDGKIASAPQDIVVAPYPETEEEKELFRMLYPNIKDL